MLKGTWCDSMSSGAVSVTGLAGECPQTDGLATPSACQCALESDHF